MGSTGRPQRDIDADVRRLIQVVWSFPLEAGTLFDATRVEDVRFTRVPLGARVGRTDEVPSLVLRSTEVLFLLQRSVSENANCACGEARVAAPPSPWGRVYREAKASHTRELVREGVQFRKCSAHRRKRPPRGIELFSSIPRFEARPRRGPNRLRDAPFYALLLICRPATWYELVARSGSGLHRGEKPPPDGLGAITMCDQAYGLI
jgi:hypothetical protein